MQKNLNHVVLAIVAAAIGLAMLVWYVSRLRSLQKRPEGVMEWAARVERENRTGHQFSQALRVQGSQTLLLVDSRSKVPGEHRAWLLWLSGTASEQIDREGVYGAAPGSIGRSLIAGTDGAYFIVGEQQEAADSYRGWIARVDDKGEIAWQQRLGAPGITGLQGGVATDDGGIIAAGDQGFRGWAVRLNAQGQEQWTQIIPEFQRISAVLSAPQGGIYLIGQSEVSTSGPGRAAVLALRADGTRLWLRDLSPEGRLDLAAAALLPDGGIVLAGQHAQERVLKLFVARLASDGGAVTWQLHHGGPREITAARGVLVRASGDLSVVGTALTERGERKVVLLGISQRGVVAWEERWGDADDHASILAERPDGHLLVAGSGQGKGPGKTQAMLWHLSPTGSMLDARAFGLP